MRGPGPGGTIAILQVIKAAVKVLQIKVLHPNAKIITKLAGRVAGPPCAEISPGKGYIRTLSELYYNPFLCVIISQESAPDRRKTALKCIIIPEVAAIL